MRLTRGVYYVLYRSGPWPNVDDRLEIQIYSKGIELNAQPETDIQKKFNRLEQHPNSISDGKLEVSRTAAHAQDELVVAQMTLNTSDYTLGGQETGLNLFTAVDTVANVMDRQIQTYKGKVYRSSRGRKVVKATEAVPAGTMAEEEEELDRPVWTKRFRMRPMTLGEATLEMELLRHDFFYNRKADEITSYTATPMETTASSNHSSSRTCQACHN